MLIDFGFSKKIGVDGGRAYTLIGSPDYIAPEILICKRQGECGCIERRERETRQRE